MNVLRARRHESAWVRDLDITDVPVWLTCRHRRVHGARTRSVSLRPRLRRLSRAVLLLWAASLLVPRRGMSHDGSLARRQGRPAGTLGAVAGFGWISLCTDYGYTDGFVAACHGVIAGIAPHARVLDVTHAIGPGEVRHGSVVLTDTLPWLPPAVHVAVVDPGVGTARRGVALVSGDAVLVGPDNGLLVSAAGVLGGVRAAYELVDPAYRLPVVSATFHGRDVFAPAAAHLAVGVPPNALGPGVDPGSLVTLPVPVCQVDGDRIRAEVLTVDHFGNLALTAGAAELAAAGLQTGATATLRWPAGVAAVLVGTTFADVAQEELVLLVDSAGRLAMALSGGSAARHTGLHPGSVVEITQQQRQASM